ncbi:His-Xaa-Ser system radical SAM maturase HxsB [Thermoproteota archaeon]
MATNLDEPTGKEFIYPYRSRTMRQGKLVITDTGMWAYMKKDLFMQLSSKNLQPEMKTFLKDKCMLVDKDNYAKLVGQQRNRYGFLFQGPQLHIILPTLRCNHKCLYCHSSAKSSADTSKDMSKETADKTLEFIFSTPSKNIVIEFQGGDALMNKDLFKYIVDEANRKNKSYKKTIKFALVTNLTLLDDETVKWIKEKGIGLSTSIDGPQELHDANRKTDNNQSSYEQVSCWMKQLEKDENLPGALMVTTKQSLDKWNDIVDEYLKWKQTSIQLKYIKKLGYGSNNWERIGYTFEEFKIFWRKSLDYILELNKKGCHIVDRYTFFALKKILLGREPGFLDFRSPCGIAIGQLAYNYNGDIYSCDEGRNYDLFKLGNVNETKFKDMIRSEKTLRLIDSSMIDNYLCNTCAYKPYCGTCVVANYSEEGSLFPKIPTNSHHLYFELIFDYLFDRIIFDAESRKVFGKWLARSDKNNMQEKHKPGWADIKLGYTCNNDCIHCVIADQRKIALKNLNREDFTTEEYKANLRSCKERGCKGVTFTGGEPTIRHDIIELLRYAHQLGFIIGMQTNGRNLHSKEFAGSILDAAPDMNFVIALHSYIHEVHDAITTKKGSFEQTVAGIKNVTGLKPGRVFGKVVISKKNMSHLKDIAELFNSLGVKKINIAFPHGQGNAFKNFDDVVPRYSEIKEEVLKTLEYGNKNGMTIDFEAITPCVTGISINNLSDFKSSPNSGYVELTQFGQKTINWTKAKKYEKLKPSTCKECKYDKMCEGPWKEYPERYGFSEFIPVKD